MESLSASELSSSASLFRGNLPLDVAELASLNYHTVAAKAEKLQCGVLSGMAGKVHPAFSNSERVAAQWTPTCNQ